MKNVTVLFPGGFKPITGAHMALAQRYAQNPNVDKVIMLIGPKERDGITRDISIKMFNLLNKNNNIEIQPTNFNSPIMAAYEYLFELPEDTQGRFALAASEKDDDYVRVKSFLPNIDKYKTVGDRSGRKIPAGVDAIELTANKTSANIPSDQTILIKSFSTKSKKDKLEVKKGSNYHTWNMRGEGAEKLEGMILWWASTQAPKEVPGQYKVILTVGDEYLTQPFLILPDPNSETDIDGMQKQFDFISDVNATMDKAHKSIKKIRNINKQLEIFQKQYKDNDGVKELVEKAKQLSEDFGKIEKALYQTKNRSGQDPLNFPIKLTNKLGHLNSLVGMDDFPPTSQDIAVKNDLTEQINTELSKFDALVSEEVKNFNIEFNRMKLDYLLVEKEE